MSNSTGAWIRVKVAEWLEDQRKIDIIQTIRGCSRFEARQIYKAIKHDWDLWYEKMIRGRR